MKKLNINIKKKTIIMCSMAITICIVLLLSLLLVNQKKEIPVAKEYKKEDETDMKKNDEINVPKINTLKEPIVIGESNDTKNKDEKFMDKNKDIDKKINNNSKGENGTKEEIQKKTRPVTRPSNVKDEVISNNKDDEEIYEDEEGNNEETLNPGNEGQYVEMEGEWGNIIANMR
ncbi:TPA: hypothetical protein KO189_002320 [Clostridioides difficile]|nr:hypothetical protein [Clostridioides difficile]HBF8970000.1 hypothetical protein [Clostridioides difficile]